MSLGGGAEMLGYDTLDCLRLALAYSFVVLLGKIGILAVTKGESTNSTQSIDEADREEGGILPVVVRVSSVRYRLVIALSFCISASYLLHIVLQVATKIIFVDFPLLLYALAGVTTFTALRWTQRIDRETRGRHFLPILRWSCAVATIFEVAIVAVLIPRIDYDHPERFWISVAELTITIFRLVLLLALLYASSPLGYRISYEPLTRPDAANERTNLVRSNGAVQNYGSSRNA